MAAEEPSRGGGSPPEPLPAAENGGGSRKERRKAAKKDKRKQKRKEMAEKERAEGEARLNDPDEQRRIEMEEERERERVERERAEFEERERAFLQAVAEKKRLAEAEVKEREEELKRNQVPNEDEKESDWEYVEDGPPEIIWQGNEIIVKKKKVKVKKRDAGQLLKIEDHSRPTSNPFPPESDSFVNSKNESVVSAQQILDNAAQQNPNFGTEQDKAHCPFQIKTGACRFGLRCSRLHFYPDKSCTLLIKNMYNGPGLAFEQDEGLEHTDEEVERSFEEFYEDVHTEFLKFGEIVNFKVCRNSSLHLRGNLYVHYKSLDSALLAYQSVNGRYFAGKQVTCEFVGVTKWRVAICGEFMRSRLKTCSRGTACNFIHCFRNPGGDYEWADWDKPPPKYWMHEMAALFGHSQDSEYDNQRNTEGRKPSEVTTYMERHPSRRSLSRERRYSRDHDHEEYDSRRSRDHNRSQSRSRKSVDYHKSKNGVHESGSDRNQSNKEKGGNREDNTTRISNRVLDNQAYYESSTQRSDSDAYWSDIDRDRDRKRNKDRPKDRNKDDDMHYKHKGKTSTPKRKTRERSDSADEDMHYKHKGKSLIPKRKTRDRSDDSADEDMHYRTKGKSSTPKRKSRDTAEDSEFTVEDKVKHRKGSRKSSRNSNEEREFSGDIKRRGRWDDKVGVQNYGTSKGESQGSDHNGSRDLGRWEEVDYAKE